MDLEQFRDLTNSLPNVVETVQWGDNLVLWVAEKSIGGKMFAVANLESGQKCVASFAAGEEGMAELCERDGISPAPYLARAHWVCIERWDALTAAEWQFRLALAHRIITDSLPKRTRELLDMTLSRRRQAIRAHKRR
jgi:predicted DNA-binding protein (MmcQ/YjbR family)